MRKPDREPIPLEELAQIKSCPCGCGYEGEEQNELNLTYCEHHPNSENKKVFLNKRDRTITITCEECSVQKGHIIHPSRVLWYVKF